MEKNISKFKELEDQNRHLSEENTKLKRQLSDLLHKSPTERQSHLPQNNSLREIASKITGMRININESSIEYLLMIQKYFEKIISKMPGQVYWVDTQGIYLGCNDELAEKAGLRSRYDIIGKTDHDLPWHEHANEYMKNDREVIQSGKIKTFEEKAKFPDGSTKIFLTQKIPLKNENNVVVGILGISIDITEKKELEENLRKAELKAKTQEEIVQVMKILGASIAHELRTPLGAINNASQGLTNYFPKLIKGYQLALESNLPVDPLRRNMLEILEDVPPLITQEVNSANMIIDMLLMNIKEKVQNKESFKKLSIVDCINEALNRYPFASDQIRNKIKWNSNQGGFYFFGDLTMTTHVLFNLLKNALFYIANDPKATIEITLSSKKDKNILCFKDTGPGISADFLPHIFERFTSMRAGGTGIGLAFCKLVMESYGGTINCQSQVGEYTSFVLEFPKTEIN